MPLDHTVYLKSQTRTKKPSWSIAMQNMSKRLLGSQTLTCDFRMLSRLSSTYLVTYKILTILAYSDDNPKLQGNGSSALEVRP